MKTKLSPTLIGLFVIGGILLLLAGVLAFGGSSLFSKPQRFVVYFDESVHGLDPGASVKVRGVRIGRVAAINVRFDETHHRSEVEVICEVTRNVLVASDGNRVDFSAPGRIDELVRGGMRAELAVVGLATGLLYVELGFHDPKTSPPVVPRAQTDLPLVPANPSAIAEFTNSVSDMLAKVRQIDFAGLSAELKGVLATARTKLDALDLQPAVNDIRSAAVAVRTLADDPQLRAAFANANTALGGLRTTLSNLDAQVTPTAEELRKTFADAQRALAEFSAASANVRRLTGPQTGLGEEAMRTFERLGEASDAVQRFLDFLERNPNALVAGPAPAGAKPPK